MSNIITCTGNLSGAKSGLSNIPNVLACDSGWEIVPYVQPTDSTLIYSELVALNEFDPARTAGIIVFCLVMFITGVGTGMVNRQNQRFISSF